MERCMGGNREDLSVLFLAFGRLARRTFFVGRGSFTPALRSLSIWWGI
jgi:hypothetical protein